jgi:hypothetical protein
MARWLVTLSLSAVLTIAVASRSVPARSGPDRASLTGITAVSVLVESLPEGAKKLGLSEQTLQTDVELKLRLAGLRVATMEENIKLPRNGNAFVYVDLNATDGAEAASVLVSLCQDVTLARNGQFASGAMTWDKAYVVANPSVQGIRNLVKDMTDEFLNDWLAANPKR